MPRHRDMDGRFAGDDERLTFFNDALGRGWYFLDGDRIPKDDWQDLKEKIKEAESDFDEDEPIIIGSEVFESDPGKVDDEGHYEFHSQDHGVESVRSVSDDVGADIELVDRVYDAIDFKVHGADVEDQDHHIKEMGVTHLSDINFEDNTGVQDAAFQLADTLPEFAQVQNVLIKDIYWDYETEDYAVEWEYDFGDLYERTD